MVNKFHKKGHYSLYGLVKKLLEMEVIKFENGIYKLSKIREN